MALQSLSDKEKRKEPRIPARLRAEFIKKGSEGCAETEGLHRSVVAKSVNVSRSGVCLLVPGQIRPGAPTKLRLYGHIGGSRLDAQIDSVSLWSKASPQRGSLAGFRFTDEAQNGLVELRDLLDRVGRPPGDFCPRSWRVPRSGDAWEARDVVRRGFVQYFLHRRFLTPLALRSRLGRLVTFGHAGEGLFVDYLYQAEPRGSDVVGKAIDRFFLSLPATRATRSKKSKLIAILQSEINSRQGSDTPLRIVDLGSGVGRYLIELTQEQASPSLQVLCLDIDRKSLRHGQALAQGLPIQHRFGDIRRLSHYARLSRRSGWTPDVIVVSTCYEFLDDGKVRASLEEVYNNLAPGGLIVVVSQIRNPSKSMMDWLTLSVGSLDMEPRYRPSFVIRKWLVESGFKKVAVEIDRWGMYAYYTGRKLEYNAGQGRLSPMIEKGLSYERAAQQRSANVYQYMRGFDPLGNGRALRGTEHVIMMATNDYLGLRTHPEVIEAATTAIERYGASPTSSRILTGNLDLHEDLQAKLAEFLHVEDTLVFATGYMANVGVVAGLVGKHDVALVDRLAHASLFDGCKLSEGTIRIFSHSNMEMLEKFLLEYRDRGARYIVCEGVYSMEGDLAPLSEICDLAERHRADVLLDDGHATGIFGKHGRGTLEHFNLEDRGCLIIGSLGKALASVGGFVAGPRVVIDYLRHTARPLLFSTGLSPANAAAALESLKIIEGDPGLIHRLWKNTDRMQKGLRQLGYDIGATQSPLIPVIIGDEDIVYKMTIALEEAGVIVDGVGPPGVKKGQCRVRLRVSAAHSDDDIARVLKVFEQVGRNFGVI